MAALKKQLIQQSRESRKQALIAKLGEEGYKAKIASDKAAAIAKQNQERATKSLVSKLKSAMAASSNGIAPKSALEGMSIGKTAAKNEWYVKPDELEKLTPVDATKKLAKYHLTDIIRLAHEKSARGSNAQHISIRLKATNTPERSKLYARYLHDEYLEERANVETLEGGEAIIQGAYEEVRGEIDKAVKNKKEAFEKAQMELKAEENRLEALDDYLLEEKSDQESGKKRASSAEATKGVDENTENDSDKKPAAKKRKVAATKTKKKQASKEDSSYSDVEDDHEAPAAAKGRAGLGTTSRRSRRNNNPVTSYAEE